MRIEFMNSNSPSRSPPRQPILRLQSALRTCQLPSSKPRVERQEPATGGSGVRGREMGDDSGFFGSGAVTSDTTVTLCTRMYLRGCRVARVLQHCEVARLRGCEVARVQGREGTRARGHECERVQGGRPLALSPSRPCALAPSRLLVASCLRAFVPSCRCAFVG